MMLQVGLKRKLMKMTRERRWSLLPAAVDVSVIVIAGIKRRNEFAGPFFASLFMCWGLIFIWYPESLGRSRSWWSPLGWSVNLEPGFVSLAGWALMVAVVPMFAIFAG
jgi:hypothetical protein